MFLKTFKIEVQPPVKIMRIKIHKIEIFNFFMGLLPVILRD
jgi:hypothetical protein